MKILMLGWELPPYNSGGLGIVCYQLAKALVNHGATIQFVLPASAQYETQSFMEIVSPGDYNRTETKDSAAITNPYTNDIASVRVAQAQYEQFVEETVRSNPPDVIHAHDWLTLQAGMKAKKQAQVPLVAHVHATEFDRAGGKTGNPLIHDIEQQGLLMADHIVAVSDATKRLIIEKYHIPSHKIEVIHNSTDELPRYVTDMENYEYLKCLKREGYIVVATIGRLTLQKGLSHFIRAAAKAQSQFGRFVFLIAGDGEQRDELLVLTADLGIADAVLFTGFVRGKAWRDIYNLADIFVMSSVSEPFGLTALEAAQHGTAIALTNQSGVSEVLRNTLRYDYWDEDTLADQLLALALSPALRSTLSQNAQHEVAQLSWAQTAQKFVDRYNSLKGIPA